MDRGDPLWLQHFNGTQTIDRPHGVVIANGDHRQFQPFFANELHVAEQPGILGQINFSSLIGGEQKSAGIAAVRPVGQL